MEYLDLNTSVGGSLSENVCWKCRHVLMALSTNEEWVEGYISPNSVGPNPETRSDRSSSKCER